MWRSDFAYRLLVCILTTLSLWPIATLSLAAIMENLDLMETWLYLWEPLPAAFSVCGPQYEILSQETRLIQRAPWWNPINQCATLHLEQEINLWNLLVTLLYNFTTISKKFLSTKLFCFAYFLKMILLIQVNEIGIGCTMHCCFIISKDFKRCGHIIYHIVFFEGYIRGFWHFKSKPISDLVLIGREVFLLPTKRELLFNVACTVQEEVKT